MENIIDKDCWKVADKTWMKERKEAWKGIKANLDVMSRNYELLKRSDHKYHKELFLYGTLNPDVLIDPVLGGEVQIYQYYGGVPFLSMLPIFLIWYHPQVERLDLDQLRRQVICGCAEEFFRDIGIGRIRASNRMYPSDEGLMGGREELCVRYICPESDCFSPIVEPQTGSEVMAPLNPFVTANQCQWGTMMELYQDARFTPYAPGHYLWPQFSYALEHFPDRVFHYANARGNYEEQKRQEWLEIIAEILRFEQRTDRSRNRPSTIAMVERLIGMYERKEFSDAMLAMWDEAKRDIKKLEPKTWQPYMKPADIKRKFGGPTIKQQEERVAMWKQI